MQIIKFAISQKQHKYKCFAVFLLIITPGRANNSPDCLLFRPFESLIIKIMRKSIKSTCALLA